METKHSVTTHRGAQLGVAALAVIGAAAGAFAFMNTNGEIGETAEIADAVRTSNDIVLPDSNAVIVPAPTRSLKAAEARVDAPDRTEPAMPEKPGEIPKEVPKPDTTVAPDPTPAPAPRLEKASFVVRIKGVEQVDKSLDIYRKDKAAAKKLFMAWAADKPEMDGLTFVSANYSGEVILSYDGATDANPVATAKELQRRITSVEGVKYADPDYTAHPGKGG